LQAAFKTASQIGFTDIGEGDDHLLLSGIHRRHLVIRGHTGIYVGGTFESGFSGKCG
jgi:hypothetical protein